MLFYGFFCATSGLWLWRGCVCLAREIFPMTIYGCSIGFQVILSRICIYFETIWQYGPSMCDQCILKREISQVFFCRNDGRRSFNVIKIGRNLRESTVTERILACKCVVDLNDAALLAWDAAESLGWFRSQAVFQNSFKRMKYLFGLRKIPQRNPRFQKRLLDILLQTAIPSRFLKPVSPCNSR